MNKVVQKLKDSMSIDTLNEYLKELPKESLDYSIVDLCIYAYHTAFNLGYNCGYDDGSLDKRWAK